MTLTLLTLDPHNRSVRNDLADVQSMHRTMQRSVESDRQTSNLLWQVITGTGCVAVQSDEPQTWGHLPPGYLKQPPAAVAEQRIVDPGVIDAVSLVNPTRVQTDPATRRKRRLELTHPDEIKEWLRRRFQHTGTVVDSELGARVSLVGRKDRMTMLLVACQIRVRVNVTDVRAFNNLIRVGVGRGKAYGCGLLIIRPQGEPK